MAGTMTMRLIAMIVAAATPFVGGCSDASRSSDAPTSKQPSIAQIGPSLDDPRSLAIATVASTGDVAAAGFASRSDLIASFTTTEFAPVLLDQTNEQLRDLTREIIGRGGDPSSLRAFEVPLTANIVATNDGAQATVWSVLVVAVPGTASPLQTWRTVTLDLVDDGDRWAINGWSSAPGPTPIPSTEGAYDAVAAFDAPLSWPPVIDKAVR
jgi:hypothetical protein